MNVVYIQSNRTPIAQERDGERVNMTGKVLEKHYDKGTSAEKAERRRDHIRDI